MSDHIDRMKKEHNELKDKISKLNQFLLTDTYKSLDDIERRALIEQVTHMECYRSVLDGRLWRAHGNK